MWLYRNQSLVQSLMRIFEDQIIVSNCTVVTPQHHLTLKKKITDQVTVANLKDRNKLDLLLQQHYLAQSLLRISDDSRIVTNYIFITDYYMTVWSLTVITPDRLLRDPDDHHKPEPDKLFSNCYSHTIRQCRNQLVVTVQWSDSYVPLWTYGIV